MSQKYIIEFQYGKRTLQKELPGPFLFTTKAFKIESNGKNNVVVTLYIATNYQKKFEGELLPDFLVGSIPLIHFSEDGKTPQLSYLNIPPPSPFFDEDIKNMWNTIRLNKCPLPGLVTLQGQYPPGRNGNNAKSEISSNQIIAEYLDLAHQECRRLLSQWPQVETYEVALRNIELRGGREDFAMTERRMGAIPISITKDGRKIPQKTIRRLQRDSNWRSFTFQLTSTKLLERIKMRFTGKILEKDLQAFMMPFAEVVKLATPSQDQIDPPFSTWPLDARQCHLNLLAAMAALEVDDQGPVPTPLSLLWELYESWISTICFEIVNEHLGFSPTEGVPKVTPGCDWTATWKLDNGIIITMLAQPIINNLGLKTSNLPHIPIQAISSNLIPDVLLAISFEEDLRIIIVDAKKRSGKMEPNAVAEAGSKYSWGIRDIKNGEKLPVAAVIIASTQQPPLMHSPLSLIHSVEIHPSTVHQLQGVLRRELDQCIDGMLSPARTAPS